ncbi:MAG TPA: acetate/propionate family kinase [Xanthobacteraceae bacterium]|nr:acetate/propionate family kinase [Xanthobacteraceae bacterium]
MDTVLVVNAGSSSVKFQVFAIEREGPRRLIKGQVSGVGIRPRMRAEGANKEPLVDETYTPERVNDVPAALHTAGAWLRDKQHIEWVAVGHRVVHGGPQYDRPVLVDASVLASLERYVSLAPLHQPNNLAPIRAIMSRSPQLPQVACFDTAFHRNHDPLADSYAIPWHLHAEGVRRYGFHGLSYEYIADLLPSLAPEIASGRVIVAHLGNGASMCAISNGRSIETTMGFTALDGLPMGTRPGQIDPGVVLYLVGEKKMSAAEVQSLLYHECGLKGLSGISSDVRDLEKSSEPRARFALDYFTYRVGLYTGQLAAALGGLDGFVFTAGIGENSASVRSAIVKRLNWLGAEIDDGANKAGKIPIAAPGSRIGLYVIPTDEELMIARHTLSLLAKRNAAAGIRKARSAAHLSF